jgi:iron complex outermembrane recepter protein
MNTNENPSRRVAHISRQRGIVAVLILVPGFAMAQAVSPTPNTTPATLREDIVELTPFEVRATLDTGYMGFETASGSRLNTSLSDTPASISVFTAEFLNDIAATNVADIAKYASNVDFDVGFIAGQPNGNSMMDPAQNITVRGLPTKGGPASGRTVNFLSYPIEIDTYNTGRVDFSRGPNSILFGLGQAGGTFNIQSRTADVRRPIFSTTLQTGSWNALRGVVDANVPLIRNRLAVRLDAVVEDMDGWRPWEYKRNKRAYVTVRYQITPRTTVDLQWEGVNSKFNNPRAYLGPDHISAWLNAGQPRVTAPLTTGGVDPISGIARISSADRWAYVWGNASAASTPLLVNYRNAAHIVNPAFASSGLYRPMIQDFTLVPRRAVLGGSGTYNKFRFDNKTVLGRHEFTRDLHIELLANQSEYNSDRRDINGPDLTIRYDPNTNLYNNPGGGTVATVPNPDVGKPYIEAYLQKARSSDRRSDLRLTAAYRLDLGRIFGTHQFAALGEHWEQKSRGASYAPRLFGRPSVVNAPENASNLVWQRTYVDLNGPVANIGLADFHQVDLPGVAYIQGNAPSYNRYYLDSWMVATQSKFWKDRIVLTLGERRDYLDSSLSTSVRDTNLAGGYTVGFFITGPANKYTYEASTRTGGVVFHLTRWAALYTNQSDNIALPSLNQFTLPDTPVPSPKGETRDVGLLLRLFENRLTTRITYYETAVVDNSTSLGTGNVQNRINAIWSAMLADGRITQQAHDRNIVRANAYNFDNTSQGWEGEVIANLTPAWRLMLNVSTNKTSLTSNGLAVRNYVAAHQATWAAVAPTNDVIADQLQLLNEWIRVNLVDRDGGKLPLTPDWTANFRTNYGFRSGMLKGFDAGLGARTRVGTFLGYTTTDPATRREITAGSHTLVDANIGYGTRFEWRGKKRAVKVQLNVNNLFNNDRLIPQTANPAGQVVNYRFQTPRQWILRTTFDY